MRNECMLSSPMLASLLVCGAACKKEPAPAPIIHEAPAAVEAVRTVDDTPTEVVGEDSAIVMPDVALAPLDCGRRDELAGSWSLVTDVAADASRGMAGVNGYYRLNVDAETHGEQCSIDVKVRKTGYGRGTMEHDQVLTGDARVVHADPGWPIEVHLDAGGGETQGIVFWLQPGSGERVEGFWHYLGDSWVENPIYGVVEGRRMPFDGEPDVGADVRQRLAECGLKGREQVGAWACR